MWINQFLQVSFCIIADIIAKYIMCINMWKNERRFIMKFVRINGENHAGYALLDIIEHKTTSMTVAELIEALSKCSPDAYVTFGNQYDDYIVETVREV